MLYFFSNYPFSIFHKNNRTFPSYFPYFQSIFFISLTLPPPTLSRTYTITTSHIQIPFGIAQIGKAFRNEITPRNFIFRSREFEQMEIEYFIPDGDEDWGPVRIQIFLIDDFFNVVVLLFTTISRSWSGTVDMSVCVRHWSYASFSVYSAFKQILAESCILFHPHNDHKNVTSQIESIILS